MEGSYSPIKSLEISLFNQIKTSDPQVLFWSLLLMLLLYHEMMKIVHLGQKT